MKRWLMTASAVLAMVAVSACSDDGATSGTSTTNTSTDTANDVGQDIGAIADAGKTCSCDAAKDTVCAVNTCDPSTGKCAMRPRNNGAPCVDGDPCTPDDKCENGACEAGKATCAAARKRPIARARKTATSATARCFAT